MKKKQRRDSLISKFTSKFIIVRFKSHRNQRLLSTESGWFTSPNYPSDYPDGADYRWFIDAKEPINISLLSIELERESDWLTVCYTCYKLGFVYSGQIDSNFS